MTTSSLTQVHGRGFQIWSFHHSCYQLSIVSPLNRQGDVFKIWTAFHSFSAHNSCWLPTALRYNPNSFSRPKRPDAGWGLSPPDDFTFSHSLPRYLPASLASSQQLNKPSLFPFLDICSCLSLKYCVRNISSHPSGLSLAILSQTKH